MVLLIFCALPFLFIARGMTIWEGQRIALAMIFLPMVAWQLNNKPIRWFAVYAFLWVVFLRVASITQRLHPVVGDAAVGAGFFLSIAIFIIYASEHIKIDSDKIYDIICWFTVFQVILGVFQANNIYPIVLINSLVVPCVMELPPGWTTGTMGNNNFYAGFLAASAPFFMRGRWKWFLIPLITLILRSNTSGAVLAVACGAIWYWRQWKIAVVAIAFTGIYIFCLDSNGEVYTNLMVQDARLWIWAKAFEYIFQLWIGVIFGYGPGQTGNLVYPYHNEFLQMWFHYGLVGLGFIGWYLWSIRYALIAPTNRIISTSFVVSMAFMTTSYPMHLVQHAMLVLIVMGLLQKRMVWPTMEIPCKWTTYPRMKNG